MRIGQFSELFQLAPETVRFYINKGLLMPSTRDDHQAFSEQEIEDMELLLKLKTLRFSLAEIQQILSLRRADKRTVSDQQADYLKLLARQKEQLIHEKNLLDEVIVKIEQEIATVGGQNLANEESAHSGQTELIK